MKAMELDMCKRLCSIEDPIHIYLDTMSQISKLIPQAQDLVLKIMSGVRDQYSNMKSNSKQELNSYQKIIEDL